MWQQTRLTLPAKSRGFHLITNNVIDVLEAFEHVDTGLLHLFLQHSSASLTINENADPTVRSDMEAHFNKFVPERAPYYQHTYEGDDDMPAHIKSSTLGCQLTIPVRQSTMLLGTWQGIYLGEHRDYASGRNIIVTLQGN